MKRQAPKLLLDLLRTGEYTPSEKEVKKLDKSIAYFEKKVNPLFNKLTKRGYSPEVVRLITGYPVDKPYLEYSYSTKQAYERITKRVRYRGTAKYRVAEKARLTKSIITILVDRLGVNPDKEGELFDYFTSMTLDQWYDWLNENWSYLKDVFEAYHAGMLGFGLYDVTESKAILARLTRGKVEWE